MVSLKENIRSNSISDICAMTGLQGYIIQCADDTLLIYSGDEKKLTQNVVKDISTTESWCKANKKMQSFQLRKLQLVYKFKNK